MDRKENLVLLAAASLWMVISAETSQATQLPGCQDKCGAVSIPYPFGTSKGCYFDEYFQITCNTTFTPPIPYLWSSNLEVLSISLDGYMRILTYVGTDCYSKSGASESYTTSYALLQAFPFSNTRNKFFGIGCDTIAYIDGVDIRGQIYSTGCLSLCSDIGSVTNGSCNGIGCCQIPIPENLLNYNASADSFKNHTNIWESNPCGFAFLAEEESFNFTIANFTNIKTTTLLPSSIDWAIGNQTCKEAKKNLTGYACKANSDCYDSSNAPGYLCNCSAGYIGNPYLPDGCQDVDECKDSNLNKCLKKCHNTIGDYKCSCPKGYHGDGRKDGEGCSADQLLVVKIVVVGNQVPGIKFSVRCSYRAEEDDLAFSDIILKPTLVHLGWIHSLGIATCAKFAIKAMFYAFIIEEKKFNFSRSSLRDLKNVTKLLVVVDWSIGKNSCAEVKKSSMYNACQGNSTCYDPDNGIGYLCRCLDGYRGNPYLPNGCLDIDECTDATINHNMRQVKEVVNIAKKCIRIKGEERPSMKEVAMELEGLRTSAKHPWTNDKSNVEKIEYLLGKSMKTVRFEEMAGSNLKQHNVSIHYLLRICHFLLGFGLLFFPASAKGMAEQGRKGREGSAVVTGQRKAVVAMGLVQLGEEEGRL
ncbi:hypothetical protein SADUNF_Sadunf02G0063900 [Salix dunnii]|uniref:EGF-like domain-containing protein n=1 Tax=Salix dunnii TaxID=1413687 RepID=A0A835TFS0_9ROSI|nr:hypothetical protein SADUNF_Sadunf02G0063900 [Salix dunnii]